MRPPLPARRRHAWRISARNAGKSRFALSVFAGAGSLRRRERIEILHEAGGMAVAITPRGRLALDAHAKEIALCWLSTCSRNSQEGNRARRVFYSRKEEFADWILVGRSIAKRQRSEYSSWPRISVRYRRFVAQKGAESAARANDPYL